MNEFVDESFFYKTEKQLTNVLGTFFLVEISMLFVFEFSSLGTLVTKCQKLKIYLGTLFSFEYHIITKYEKFGISNEKNFR